MPTSQSAASRSYAGPERRKASRIPANYPIRILHVLSTGEKVERYSQTKNVSSEGILFSSSDLLQPDARVDVSVGIPFVYAPSLPAAQLDGEAVVVWSEPARTNENGGFGGNVALKFLRKPTVSTNLSMFD